MSARVFRAQYIALRAADYVLILKIAPATDHDTRQIHPATNSRRSWPGDKRTIQVREFINLTLINQISYFGNGRIDHKLEILN